MHSIAENERLLCQVLVEQPSIYHNRYTANADRYLREILFRSIAAQRDHYLALLFPDGVPAEGDTRPWSLRTAQGAIDGAEYTAAAKGTACGHIFKSGESTYHCKTCASDDTCVLCLRCFDASDHEGHSVFISVSPGNSGCCDCGDSEAWRQEVRCSIHTPDTGPHHQHHGGKEKARVGTTGADLPVDLVEAIRMTIARSIDYLCDVFSCSPEQMKLPKTLKSVLNDELQSRLGGVYGTEPQSEEETEYALILWNDEKHTTHEVQNQLARACAQTKKFGLEKAIEVDGVGRSVIHYSTDLSDLMQMAQIIEQINVTVTIRSARDTFREHMCATIIDWISDIAGCSVGHDPHVLRDIVCEELLRPWRTGSEATNKEIGLEGIYDHEMEDQRKERGEWNRLMRPFQQNINIVWNEVEADDGAHDNNEDDDDEDEEYDDYDFLAMEEDNMDVEIDVLSPSEAIATSAADGEMDIDFLDENADMTETGEATRLPGYRPPPPPPPPPAAGQRRQIFTPADSDDGDADQAPPSSNEPYANIPRTPKPKTFAKRPSRAHASKHWLEKPDCFRGPRPSEPCEDLWQRVRLDFLILYDLRLWKTLRIHLRHLYITTVVTVPQFKRILGLRFAGLYSALAQLYLVADREPDHSIINLSVQMLTTPSITQEVVERGNFLTNLMAILYTFLTTRQVGFPEDVSPRATLAFDAGAVTNRRMFHFFLDLRWLFQSHFIHHSLRVERRYLLQFLDLVKLHQGICPNVRATGEHVEYESDAWISASMIVKEMNKLCKQIAISFEPTPGMNDTSVDLQRAIRTVAQVVMINSYGYERKRFHVAELKNEMQWHLVGPFDDSEKKYSVPKHVVQTEPMSFHHPLHYVLSWLIENAKGMSRDEVRALLHFSPEDLKDPWNISRNQPTPATLTSDDLLSAIFDHPLRVCVWLAQMKAGMWVRNGITLRHQAHSYRGVSYRDVGYQRDILMVQSGLVLCGSETEHPGERFLAQMIDRFQMTEWFKGDYSVVAGFEELQQLDVIEDFFHLLVIAFSERGNLVSSPGGKEQHEKILKHDIAHALCFKPLSFSDIAGRVTEKVGESDDFNRVLESMTTYRPPEGLYDTGTFELKPEYIELVDPFYAHYSRNHREEAEAIYKKHMAHKNGTKADDVVFEPNLQPITSGLFANLSAFTRTPLFAQVLAMALNFAVGVHTRPTNIQVTRIETFLHMVLHLIMMATSEDRPGAGGLVEFAAMPQKMDLPGGSTQSVASLLLRVLGMDEYAACHPTLKRILDKMVQIQPKVASVIGPMGAILDRSGNDSPASLSAEDKERKKQEALARQARVMAQMKQQQNSFMQNQGLSGFDVDFDDLDDMSITGEAENVEHKQIWTFPTGTCIWCQEETDDQRLYGMFAFLGESDILRSTPTDDLDFIEEVVGTPRDLDRPADHLRPFGVAGKNKHTVEKSGAGGKVVSIERQGLSKGFPHQQNGIKGPVSTSCGHIMHYSCFELYLQNSIRRHQQQIARNHPENTNLNEFTCPMCKALGNTFLPIIWMAKECAHEHELHAAKDLGDWLLAVEDTYIVNNPHGENSLLATQREQQFSDFSNRSSRYVNDMFAPALVSSMNDLSLASPSAQASQRRFSPRRGYSWSRLFSLNRNDGDQDSPNPSGQADPVPRMAELMKAYQRIDETINVNELSSPDQIKDGTFNPVSKLSRALGLSISAFEIAHRGIGNDALATSLLADLPDQALTHFRVLSETIESYLAVNVLRPSPINPVARETLKRRATMTCQLFGLEPDYGSIERFNDLAGTMLFQDDTFLFFVDWLSFMVPNVAEASSVMQLCYWAEAIKTILVYTKLIKQNSLGETLQGNRASEEFKHAVLIAMTGTRDEESRLALSSAQYALLRHVVEKYTLAFLRKCIVVMRVRYGLDFECPYNIDPETPELQRLTALLHLPSLDDICTLYIGRGESSRVLNVFTRTWITQVNHVLESRFPGFGGVVVPHPSIFELVGLPKNYDVLTEEAIKRKCPTTGKEISDPAVCLFCGEIFCSQAVCCMRGKNKGGCYMHMDKCGSKVGAFINIKKCMVLFMHGPGNGSYSHAPYLDKHGEPDPTLRRHHQLYLNERRYDKLIREVWLQHLIPTVISRKLEGDINPGGWETL